MKIALMTNNYKPIIGGVPISIERLKGELERLGHQVTVFAPTYENQEEESGVFRYATLRKDIMGGIVLPNPFDRRIEQEFRKQKFDIIHVHHPMLIGKTAVHLAKKYHIPLVFTYHTRYEQYLCYVKPIQLLEKRALKGKRLSRMLLSYIQEKIVPSYLRSFIRHCDYVLAPTEGLREYLHNTCHVEYDKLGLLPTGLDRQSFSASEEEAGRVREKYQAEKIPLLLSVSRMAHEKNILFLLESIARLKALYQKPFRVLLAGDGPDREAYEHRLAALNLTEEVVFVGEVENSRLAPYFKAADAFIFTSKTETQGIVILEAFAGGTPVYALDATGVRDLVKEGVNGYLSPENVDSYASILLNLLNGKDNAKALSAGALNTARDYKEESVAINAIRLYNRIIAVHKEKTVSEDKGLYGKQISYFGSGR